MAIDGTYKGTATSPLGAAECVLTLATDGEKLTGSASAMGVTAAIERGVAEGNLFACLVEGDGPLGHMALDIKGAVEGDVVKGTITVGRIVAAFEGMRV